MDRNLFHQALHAESRSPKQALRLYDQLADANRREVPGLLIIGVLGPALAALIAYIVTRNLAQYQTEITVAILYMGFAPIFRRTTVSLTQSQQEPPSLPARLMTNTVMFTLALLNDALLLLIVALLSVVTVLVVMLPWAIVTFLMSGLQFPMPWDAPLPLMRTLGAVALVFWMLFALADIPPRNLLTETLRDQLEMVPVGLRLRATDNFQFFGGLLLGTLFVGAGPLGLLYDYPWQAVFMSAVTGLLFALSFRSLPGDFVTSHMIELGRARCLLQLGRLPEVRWRMDRVIYGPRASCPRQLVTVATVLHALATRNTHPDDLARIPQVLRSNADVTNTRLAPYQSLWRDSLDETLTLYQSLLAVRYGTQRIVT